MRIYISIDMEGVAGVTHPSQIEIGRHDYEQARRWMTGEANAAIRGAFAGGAREVVVNDAHMTMRNLLLAELDPRAEVVTGSPKPRGMTEGIDLGFDGAFFVGYHAAAGRPGVLNHSYNHEVVSDIRLNGEPAGELEVNSALAGQFGVPVVLVSGDNALCSTASKYLPGVETVPVKQAITRYAARSLTPAAAQEKIEQTATHAVERLARGEFKPVSTPTPVTMEIVFTYTAMADMAMMIPGVEQHGPLSVRFTQPDMERAYSLMRVLIALGSTVLPR